MARNDFDPTKLNIDFSNIEPEKEVIKESAPVKEISIIEAINETKKPIDILESIQDIKKDEIDLATLSTFLTDNEVMTDELKKIDAEKKEIKITDEKKDTTPIFDVNINSIDDIVDILIKNQYDFWMIVPSWDYIKVILKKDQVIKETKNIKFHIYSNLLLQAKKISKLKLEETNIEQKWVWEYKFRDKNLEILSRTVPGNFWETLYLKIKESDKKIDKKQNTKKRISAWTAFSFLWAILFIALVLWAVFLTFVIFNAKVPSDVSFFANLWINLNDVNSFLLKVTTLIFSVVILVEAIILIIVLFKWILTKKEFKRKKTVYFILATILIFISFWTWTLWITLDKAINNLPNWQEMSYGNIQIFDNDVLKSPNFDKSNALIGNYTSIIWPIDLKFDLTYLKKDELRWWFDIKKYIWDFWDWTKVESQNPEIIQNFDKKWNFAISLTLEWIDKRFPNKISQKPASDMPTISISQLVKITQNTTENGWKTISFDATDLKSLWEIEWYFKDDLSKPAYVWEFFQPSKIYFEEDSIGMLIRNQSNAWKYMDRVFVVSGKKATINWEIQYEASIDDDLKYTFKVNKLENTSWAWFIKSFKWYFENKESYKDADILNLEDSSEVDFRFANYWKQNLKVIITNTAWKSTEIKKEINVPRKLRTKNFIEVSEDNTILDNVKFDEKWREYSIFNLWVPNNLKFDAKLIRADDPMYIMDEISWDIWSDGTIESKEKFIEHKFDLGWFSDITVNYKFVHRKDKKEVIILKDIILLELIEKEAIVSFEVKTDSEYTPTIASFDASVSKVKWDNIVKFIYDYGDGIIEKRDAINPGHKYLVEWNYKIKLTIVTEKWKEYSTSKSLILKSPLSAWKITVSMKKAPINQEIDFLSTWSIWQIVWYHWDFWDGNTSNDANPSYTYTKPWKYKVILTLEYANNNIIKKDIEVEIIED